MTLFVITLLVTLLTFQQTSEPPEVKYNVAFIAALASVIVALISAAYSIINLRTLRKNQRALQQAGASSINEE